MGTIGTYMQYWVNSDIEIKNNELISSNTLIQDLGKAQNKGNNAIMHEWERPIMEKDAENVTRNGGRILNVGHGMGIIDGFIRNKNPEHHTIVEIHPEIVANAKANGYTDVYHGDWIDFIKECKNKGVKYDGIYFDTYCFDNRQDWILFAKEVHTILNPNGIFSYFNGGAAKKQCVKEYLIENNWKYTETTVHLNIKYIENGEEISHPMRRTCIYWENN